MRYILFLLIVCFCGCHRTQQENPVLRVSVLRGPSVIAFANWLENPPTLEGKQVKIKVLDSPDLVQASLIKGETDIAVLPMINAANLYNKGIDIRLAGCPIWGTLYLVEKTSEKEAPLYLFGGGTTPDILTRFYLKQHQQDYPLNYAFSTPGEITQGILTGKVGRAVLGEPFLSIVLRKDSTLRITADLNHPEEKDSIGFPQTAIVYTPQVEIYRMALERELQASCLQATREPGKTIKSLVTQGIFTEGMLSPESIERCKIQYRSAGEVKKNILDFLRLIEQYEPKAIGGKLPDSGFIADKP